MGYEKYVKELLADECEVYFSEDNGRFAAYTLWQVNQMFKQYGHFDVVHWNNGYWDMNIEAPMRDAIHPIDEYLHYLNRIIKEIRYNGADIIFATTTPILFSGNSDDNTGIGVKLNYDNDWVVQYNTSAKELMKKENITVNDLYELMKKDEHFYKCEDLLHLTEEGSMICAKQAAEMIREKLQ